jgi:hypothetical protein
MEEVKAIDICVGKNVSLHNVLVVKQWLTSSCARFQSGFFYMHPLLDDLEYYW